MKKIINIIFICFLFMIGSVGVKAEACDNEDIAKLKELVKNITYHSEYVGARDLRIDLQSYDVSFDFGELDGKIYIADSVRDDSNKVYHSTDKFRVESGSRSFYIYYDSCDGKYLGKIDVQLKKFNEYSLRDECFRYEDTNVDVCDEWYQGSLTNSQFTKAISEYYEEKKEEVNDTSMSFKDIITTYYYYFIGVCILLIAIIIILVIKHIKDSRLD